MRANSIINIRPSRSGLANLSVFSNSFHRKIHNAAKRDQAYYHTPIVSKKDIYKLLAYYTKNYSVKDNVLSDLTEITNDCSEFKIYQLVILAVKRAKSQECPSLTLDHFIEARAILHSGHKVGTHSEAFNRIAAIHEAGHALVAHSIGYSVIYATIEKRRKSAGYVLLNKINLLKIDDCLNLICFNMGGYASEELQNIDKVISESTCEYDISFAKEIAELIKNEIYVRYILRLSNVDEIIEAQKNRARLILSRSPAQRQHLINSLLLFGHLNHKQLRKVILEKTPREVTEFSAYTNYY